LKWEREGKGGGRALLFVELMRIVVTRKRKRKK